MAISVTSVSTVATRAVKDLEDKAEKEIAEILSILINRANADNNHPDLELTKLFLNRHIGDNMEKLLEKLGASAAAAPLGLPAGGTTLGSTAPGGVIVALDESNNVIPGVAWRTADLAEQAGYTVVVMTDDGSAIKGMKKPPAPTTPPPAPAPADEVEVVDRRDNIKRRIPRSEYESHVADYVVTKVDPATHKPTQVRETRVIGR